MVKELIARGQVTLTRQQDAYTISQSLGEYIFSATNDGTITSTASVVTEISVTQNDSTVNAFTIGKIAKPAGFATIDVDNEAKSVTFIVVTGTTTLDDHGAIDIPITIAGTTYHLCFVWSKAKAGAAGVDANMLDWVTDWNSGKTQIGESTIITPKLFAGVKNPDATLTGTAIGRYPVTTKTASGTLATETINGICGFKDGYETFSLDNNGNAQLGRGDQYVKYDASTGKIEFGRGVSLLWAGATYIDKNGIFTGSLSAATITTLCLDASQITSGKIAAQYIDVKSLITAGNIEALTLNVTQGKIGGWSIDTDSIFRGAKNNIQGTHTLSLGDITLGSNGLRGHMWSLDSSGAGTIAGGNIAWDAVGNVTFGEQVKLAWQSNIDSVSELARAMAYGKMLFRDPTFAEGMNGVKAYNNSGNSTVTVSRVSNPQAPNDSHQVLEVATSGAASPGIGGFFFGHASAANKIFIARIIAKFPVGYRILWASNSTGTGGAAKCLTSSEGTGKWTEYIFKVVCGAEGVFSTTNYFYLLPSISVVYPVVWSIAYATVFDITSAECLTTTINGDGIYTGSLTAGQITAGVLSADRIAAGSINAEKLDAGSIRASIINAGYISGLNCTFTQGKIGGWSINSATLSGSNIVLDSANRRIAVFKTGASQSSGQRAQFYFNSDTDFGIVVTDIVGTYVVSLGSTNKIAGWVVTTATISKGNVSLGADGSISNATKWMFNNDGSGQVASGNISWNAAGAVTFSSAVSLAWTAPISTITSALGGSSFPKLTNISATGVYTGTLTASQVNAVQINAESITAGTLSVDRIAAGSLKAEKLDAASIKATIINTDYINGLNCSFVRGAIGGWTIDTNSITAGNIGAAGQTPIQIRPNSTGSGYWYAGEYRPFGMTMTWHQSANAGHIVFGQVAATGNTPKTGFVGIQMMSWDNQEYFCLSANYTFAGSKEVYNRIAGWAFDHNHIWKNSVSLGADGSVQNSTKWQLNNDGSGCVASGNIAWDAAGNVTFGALVSLVWTTGINAITTALGGVSYPKLTQISATGIYTGIIKASQIIVDSSLIVGGSSYNGSISVRDAANVVKATLDRSGITAVGGCIGGWIINEETICAAAPDSGHRVYLTSSGYLYNDNPSTGKDYWSLRPDGSATFGYGSIQFQKDGSGYVAGGNLLWDAAGNLTAIGGNFKNVTIEGTIRSAFVRNDPSIWVNWGDGTSSGVQTDPIHYDNVVCTQTGGWGENINLQWTLNQSGRRICLINYKWGSTVSTGYMSISAPTGKYFYENGIAKSTLSFSREVVELLGYGDNATFFGWIVMNRRDMMCEGKYGQFQQVLAQGVVTSNSGNSASIKYKTFDGSTMSVSKTSPGWFYVYMPWSLGADKYMVMLTGKTVSSEGTPIYATVWSQYASYFLVSTQDDASTNDGSFNFQVLSTADFK